MASTSYANNSNINYVFDIFLNHRGPDCKKTLAKHLYERLTKEGLRVFLDVDELQAGENITPQIESAIRTALVHIAIFTPGYAASPWCLNELLLMFESGSTIIPVFHGVKPSVLRWGTQGEKGVYGQALQRLEKKETIDSQPRYDSNTIQKWRKALSDVAEIKGLDIETCNGDEQQLLQQVVEGVLKKVKRPVHVCRYPTGLDEKVEEFERAVSLEQQNRETKVIGIVGLGGVGKTTVAKQMFNRRRSNYKKSFFLFDVRETAARNSLIWLQSKILEGLGQSNVQIDSTDDGIEKLNRYLSSCRGREYSQVSSPRSTLPSAVAETPGISNDLFSTRSNWALTWTRSISIFLCKKQSELQYKEGSSRFVWELKELGKTFIGWLVPGDASRLIWKLDVSPRYCPGTLLYPKDASRFVWKLNKLGNTFIVWLLLPGEASRFVWKLNEPPTY